MKDKTQLAAELRRIDGKGYGSYKDLAGPYDMGGFILRVDHVQGDPFASPSRLRVEVDRRRNGFTPGLDAEAPTRLALADFLARAFSRAIKKTKSSRSGPRGMGKSGLIEIDSGGQEILRRTAVFVSDDRIEVRFTAGLPARGRTVLGRQAEAMLIEEVPRIVADSLSARALDMAALGEHSRTVEDWTELQKGLAGKNLVSFIADGSLLPRRSGVDPRPLNSPSAVRFQSPPQLRVEMSLPGGRKVAGMGVPEGVTLIVGGGFHGKSTLLEAVSLGVYPHVPGDGRELVATIGGAVKIRAEDGRRVEAVDISPFIDNLPFGKDTKRFSTDNASGSTSQAANIMEALEMGAKALLVDEDTSATNFMIRDRRMQVLVEKGKEPITPFIDRVRDIYREKGCSTVIVVGGSGDYLDVADAVIQMDEYAPMDVTDKAARVAGQYPTGRAPESGGFSRNNSSRFPAAESFDARKGKREVKIVARGLGHIQYGETTIDVSALGQLVDESQTRAIGELIRLYSTKYLKERVDLKDGVEAMARDVAEKGLEAANPRGMGNLAEPRAFEVAAAINRMRTLKVK